MCRIPPLFGSVSQKHPIGFSSIFRLCELPENVCSEFHQSPTLRTIRRYTSSGAALILTVIFTTNPLPAESTTSAGARFGASARTAADIRNRLLIPAILPYRQFFSLGQTSLSVRGCFGSRQ